jgi:hypothetical protein
MRITEAQHHRAAISLTIIFLILGWAFLEPAHVGAQWTNADASGNINNTNSGNVGIGTSTPSTLLEINKSQNAGTVITVDNGYGAANNGAYSAILFKQAGTQRFIIAATNSNNSAQIGGANAVQLWNFGSGPMLFGTGGVERIRIDAAGNVGVGTATPGSYFGVPARLDVSGPLHGVINANGATGYSSAITFSENGVAKWALSSRNSYDSPSNRLSFFNNSSNEVLTVLNSGNVGIGTTNPQARLDVNGSVAISGALLDTAYGRIRVGNGVVTPTVYDAYATAVVDSNPAGVTFNSGLNGTPNLNAFNFNAPALGSTQKLISFKSAGVEKAYIDANGNISLSGNISAKYQDVAEWVPSSQNLKAGTVVILDPEKSNQVIASKESYDTRVAGVVSDNPGVILGEGGEGKVKVATTGRVRVRVDATRAPIKIGDLLVTSDEEGIAMKSVPVNFQGRLIHSPGTIIGKALEPLEKGRGEILVLLSLQ